MHSKCRSWGPAEHTPNTSKTNPKRTFGGQVLDGARVCIFFVFYVYLKCILDAIWMYLECIWNALARALKVHQNVSCVNAVLGCVFQQFLLGALFIL